MCRCEEARIGGGASVDVSSMYETLSGVGLQYGASFRGLRSLSRGVDEALGRVQLSESTSVEGYGLHPALLDAALQTSVAMATAEQLGARLPDSSLGPCDVCDAGGGFVGVGARAACGGGRCRRS